MRNREEKEEEEERVVVWEESFRYRPVSRNSSRSWPSHCITAQSDTQLHSAQRWCWSMGFLACATPNDWWIRGGSVDGLAGWLVGPPMLLHKHFLHLFFFFFFCFLFLYRRTMDWFPYWILLTLSWPSRKASSTTWVSHWPNWLRKMYASSWPASTPRGHGASSAKCLASTSTENDTNGSLPDLVRSAGGTRRTQASTAPRHRFWPLSKEPLSSTSSHSPALNKSPSLDW